MRYDVIVAGLGAMGSAAAYHLARNGLKVLGLDRFQPPHNFGSSHGLSRIIREAYFEHPIYVPLVQRAYELWAELEQESGRRLFVQTGGLMIGPPNGPLVSGAKRSAEEHRLRHELLSASELRSRFPAFNPTKDMVAIWEPRAGMLFPEPAIQMHLELAVKHGATLQFHEPVAHWESHGDGVQVRTAKATFEAKKLLISAGAWVHTLLPDLKLPLSIERQVLYWFDPRESPNLFEPEQCPIFICQYGERQFFYGFPNLGDGVKVAFHHEGEPTQPDALRREVSEHEVEEMRSVLEQFLPKANGPLKSAVACMYTNAPDEHFVLDRHPLHRQVLIASPCSGHGFKFSPVIGEIAADLLREREPRFDLSLFRLSRFSN